MNGKFTISIFGAHVNSANLGCQALTYSLLSLLESISKEMGIEFEYKVFEYAPNSESLERMCDLLFISRDKISNYPMLPIYNPRSYIKHFAENIEMINIIRKSNIAIDLTAGDSFSDIYGDARFISLTKTKRIVELLGTPLLLGPQTYGPYLKINNQHIAKSVFLKCKYIIARDKMSANVASELSKRNVDYTTDLAFGLSYKKRQKDSGKIQIGFNISGLLVSDHIEKGIENTVQLNTKYDEYVELVLSYLCKSEQYNVTLLAHVEEDLIACNKFHSIFSSTAIAPLFYNPIDIKSYISGFDIFIGARMHATIAAFTSGVVTIPTAYSRKFSGLYEVVDYRRIIDLQKLTTEEAVSKTISYITHYKEISKEVEHSLLISEQYNTITRTFFKNAIRDNIDF